MMDKSKFFAQVRKDFGPLRQRQVDGFNRYIDATIGMDITWQAYIIATVWHETGEEMYPVRETKAKTDGSAVNILENAFKSGKLPWVKTPYWRFDASGKTWLGRGDVQVTHKYNYIKASKYAGIDLTAYPEKMLDPKVSVKVTIGGMRDGVFTGKKLSDYLPNDYVNARRIINGKESAAKVAGYAVSFERALRAGSVVDVPAPTQAPTHRDGWLAVLIKSIMKALGK